jgi:osmotically-inducible protein OsmY
MDSSLRDAGSQDARDSLIKQVEAYVRERLGGRIRDFRVIHRDGGFLLQGRSRTQHAKQLVQQAVLEIADRPIVANEIRV